MKKRGCPLYDNFVLEKHNDKLRSIESYLIFQEVHALSLLQKMQCPPIKTFRNILIGEMVSETQD